MDKQRVLFLCTHNSARSQMAEGMVRHLAGDRFDAYSTGTEATRVHPLAIRAMAEVGTDISNQESKTLDRYLEQPFNAVVTVCDQANESCPVFLGARERLHWSFPDPSRAAGTEEEQLAAYRTVRDAIRARIELELLHSCPPAGRCSAPPSGPAHRVAPLPYSATEARGRRKKAGMWRSSSTGNPMSATRLRARMVGSWRPNVNE